MNARKQKRGRRKARRWLAWSAGARTSFLHRYWRVTATIAGLHGVRAASLSHRTPWTLSTTGRKATSMPNSVSPPPCLPLREESQCKFSHVHSLGKPVAGSQSDGTV